MKIGILQTGHTPDQIRQEQGDYDQMFARLLKGNGFTFETWNVVDNDFPSGPDDAGAWLITGSKHGVYEDHAWIAPLEDLIRRISVSGRRMVGICFGHQIIAQALGGRVEKYAGGWIAGLTRYQFGDKTVRLNAWHQDQVISLPPAATVLGSGETCRYAALRYGDQALTFQAHPEFDRPVIEGLLKYRAPGVVPQPLIDQAQDRLHLTADNAPTAWQIAGFLRGKEIS